jgi:hypothetical protein
MLEQIHESYIEDNKGVAYQPRTVEILTGAAGSLVTAVVFYLLFFDGVVGF